MLFGEPHRSACNRITCRTEHVRDNKVTKCDRVDGITQGFKVDEKIPLDALFSVRLGKVM